MAVRRTKRRLAKYRNRPKPGRMNKTEQRFDAYLQLLTAAGEVEDYRFEPFRLRLTTKDWLTTYTPDFGILYPQDRTIELCDIKGGAGWEDDARVKIKIAASEFWWFRFAGYTEDRGGNWKKESF